ncbi:MAG: alpha/beta fold hydrolase [Pseudomonadota bacterium]
MGSSATASADTAALFGQADATWDAQISPDGAHLALGCSPNGRMAVCVYETGNSEVRPKLIEPTDDQRLLNFYWASDNHVVSNISYFDRVNTSNGIVEVEVRRALSYSLERDRSVMLMRQASNYDHLTDVKSVCDADPQHVLMELSVRLDEAPKTGSLLGTTRGGVFNVLYEVDLDTGRMQVRESDRASVWTYILDPACKVSGRVVFNDTRGEFSIEIGDDRNRRTLFERTNTDRPPLRVRGFNVVRTALIVDADFEDFQGYHELDLETGSLTPLSIGDTSIGEKGLIVSPYDDTILGYHAIGHLREEVFFEPTIAELQTMLGDSLPGRTITLVSLDRAGDRFTFRAVSPGAPAEFYLVDLVAGQIQPVGNEASQLEGRGLGRIEPFRYTARDGVDIPAYLTLPPGKTRADGPFPTIVMPHGGPEARDTADFNWWVQAFASEGYAVIQPNFRGSSGYGAEFRNRGFGEFGGAMVDDVVDAIDWAESEGVSMEAGVCVAGGSYGGYSALMTALRAPDKVGCVVAVAPVTDVYKQMARFGRNTYIYNYWVRYVGGGVFSDEADKRDITPEDRAGEFRAPVLLIHGSDDQVVRPQQSRNFEEAWGRRPGLRYVKLEGSDHYLTSTTARTTVLRESLAYLAAHHPAR